MRVLRKLGSQESQKNATESAAESEKSAGSDKSPGSSRGRADSRDASEQLPPPKTPSSKHDRKGKPTLGRRIMQGATALSRDSPTNVPGLLRMFTSKWNTQDLVIEPVHFQMAREMVGDPLLALGGVRDTTESQTILDKLEILQDKPVKLPPELFVRGTSGFRMRQWSLHVKARHWYIILFSVLIVIDSIAMALKMDDVISPTASLLIEAILGIFFVFDVFVNTMGIDDLSVMSVVSWIFDTSVVAVASADVWVLRLLEYTGIIHDVPQLGNVRVLRLSRLVKVFRLLETMLHGDSSADRKEIFRPLRMVVGLIMKGRNLIFYLMCTLVAALGLCAVLTRVVFDEDGDVFDPTSVADNYFNTVPDSFVTLVNLASGTLIWKDEIFEVMKSENPFGVSVLYACQYVIIIYVVLLTKAVAFLMLSKQGDTFDHHEELAETKKKFDFVKIKAALERIDMNNNGHINTDELEYCLRADPSLESTLSMTTEQLMELHSQLDLEGSGRVSIGLLLLSMFSEIVGTRNIDQFVHEHRIRKVQAAVVDSMNCTTQLCRRLYESLFLQCKLMDTIEEIESSYHELIQPVNAELEQCERSVDALMRAVSSSAASDGAPGEMSEDVKGVETLKFVSGMLQLTERIDEWRTADDSLAVDSRSWDPVQGLSGHLKHAMDEWKRSEAYKSHQVQFSSESESE